MQGKSLAQNNKKRGRSAPKKPSARTRRMLPDESQENNSQAVKQAEAEAKQQEKQAKLEARQAKKQAALEAREAKKLARQAEKQAKLEANPAKLAQGGSALGNQKAPARPGHDSSEAPKPERKKVNIDAKAVIKYTVILLSISAVLSVALLFLLDLTGWRSAVRNKVVGYLISKEREVLHAQMTDEYDSMVDGLVEQRLAGERQALALDQEAVAAKESELATRQEEINIKQKDMEDKQSQLDTELEAFKQQKADFDEEKLAFENSKIELAEIAKLYAGMEPENAADIISVMKDQKLVVKIFSNMKKDDAAGILELMDAQKAADIISEMGE